MESRNPMDCLYVENHSLTKDFVQHLRIKSNAIKTLRFENVKSAGRQWFKLYY